jgi:hypothetical protein
MRKLYILPFALLLALPLLAADGERPESGEEEDPIIFDVNEYGDEWRLGDTNGDGSIDYALRRNDEGEKEREAVDFNGDGQMDDFYYYSPRGALIRQEVDTNYDGAVDLWVHLHRGVYVSGYERDTNYDGQIDIVKDFDEE